MSRIAKHPIKLPSGVEAKLQGKKLSIKGKKGELQLTVSNDIGADIKDGGIQLRKLSESRHAATMWGTTASLIRGMIKGVSEGYTKRLLIEGGGYIASEFASIFTSPGR